MCSTGMGHGGSVGEGTEPTAQRWVGGELTMMETGDATSAPSSLGRTPAGSSRLQQEQMSRNQCSNGGCWQVQGGFTGRAPAEASRAGCIAARCWPSPGGVMCGGYRILHGRGRTQVAESNG